MLRTPQECQVTGSSRAVELLQDSTNTTLGTNSFNLGPRLTWWFELWLLLVWCCCFFPWIFGRKKQLGIFGRPASWPSWHTDFTLASIFESSKKSDTTIHASMAYTLFPSTGDVVYDAMWCEGKIHPAKLLSGDIPGIGNVMFSWPWVEYHNILWFTVSPPFFPGRMMWDDALSRKMELNS